MKKKLLLFYWRFEGFLQKSLYWDRDNCFSSNCVIKLQLCCTFYCVFPFLLLWSLPCSKYMVAPRLLEGRVVGGRGFIRQPNGHFSNGHFSPLRGHEASRGVCEIHDAPITTLLWGIGSTLFWMKACTHLALARYTCVCETVSVTELHLCHDVVVMCGVPAACSLKNRMTEDWYI